ncbi:hypothetical protein B0H14DRAFT_2565106 [Mycena olivaceomarginata]|nr:hypothetical protein B0H14DRAFT_2565106 [Mycena olivaceomarginata]
MNSQRSPDPTLYVHSLFIIQTAPLLSFLIFRPRYWAPWLSVHLVLSTITLVQMTPSRVYVQEKKAVELFTLPISHPGPSNLPVPRLLKRKASKEPEGSSSKHINTGEAEITSKNGDNNKDVETVKNKLEKDINDKGKTHAKKYLPIILLAYYVLPLY